MTVAIDNIRETAVERIETEEQLAAYIVSQNPGLMECLKSWNIIGAVFTLRGWVSGFINAADRDLLFEPQDVVSAFHVFREKKQGVWCGGAGKFFTWVLRLFSIPAVRYTYSHPEDPNLGHVTTLFCDISDDRLPVYLADAYLDYHYIDADTSEMLQFERLLEYVAQRRHGKIKMIDNPVCRSLLLLEKIPPLNMGAKERIYPDRREFPDPVDRDGVWEYPSARAITWSDVIYADYENIDLFRGGRSREEFFTDLMIRKPNVQRFDISEVDKRMIMLLASVGIH